MLGKKKKKSKPCILLAYRIISWWQNKLVTTQQTFYHGSSKFKNNEVAKAKGTMMKGIMPWWNAKTVLSVKVK